MTRSIVQDLPARCGNLACPSVPGEGRFVTVASDGNVVGGKRPLVLALCAPCAEALTGGAALEHSKTYVEDRERAERDRERAALLGRGPVRGRLARATRTPADVHAWRLTAGRIVCGIPGCGCVGYSHP